MEPNLPTQLKRLIAGVAWVFGVGVLTLAVFVLSFYVAMKIEMRSTEVVVPDVTGMDKAEAERTVTPLGLKVEVADQRHDPAVSSGRVLQQEPKPGSAVRRGRRVKLVISLGGRVLTVPEVVGERARKVEISLRREGFSPGDEAYVHDFDAPAGTVIAQVPPPGGPAVPGERVHRLVSLGRRDPVWVMPDLTGRPRREVERWLELCGFRLAPVRRVRSSGEPPGTVVGQLPVSGYPIRRRDVVHLTVAL